MVSPVHGDYRRCQAEIPLIVLCRFPGPALRPQALSSLFKVAHHGSSNAQCDDVWRLMLVRSAHAVVTPYEASRLPRPEGVQWLTVRTSHAYATGLLTGTNIRRRPEVERMIKDNSKGFSSLRLPEQPGVLRFRKRAGSGGNWAVEMFGDARKL
jgi:hypothetical protein